MPAILLAIRVEVCKLMQEAFPLFAKRNPKRLTCKINDLITQILDPNQFLSRFSLIESRKDGIRVRDRLAKTGQAGPSLRKGFYTRSALVRSVIPQPADGKVRVLFGTGLMTTEIPAQSPAVAAYYSLPQMQTERAEPEGPKRLALDKGTVTFS